MNKKHLSNLNGYIIADAKPLLKNKNKQTKTS